MNLMLHDQNFVCVFCFPNYVTVMLYLTGEIYRFCTKSNAVLRKQRGNNLLIKKKIKRKTNFNAGNEMKCKKCMMNFKY